MTQGVEPERHRLLARQLRRATGQDGVLDMEKLLGLIEGAYREHDQAREIDHRAMTVAARELTDLNRTLSEARDAADAANSAKGQFLSAMSHEIRTPLNGVLGTAAALGRTPLAPDQRAMLDVMLDSGNLLTTILNDILDLAKIESGRLDLEAAPFDLPGAIRSVVDLFRCTADEKGLDLSLDIAQDGAFWVSGDTTRLRQVIQNLLSNAIKFTPAGAVAVKARIASSGNRVQLALDVQDSGIGVSEEACSRLFQRFSQADNGIARRFGGTGLGLALCRDLMSAMGGTIEMRPGEVVGSVFRLEVAFDVAQAPELAQDTEAGVTIFERPVRVLAADDNATNRFVLRTLLESLGAEVVLVENGADAIAAVETGDFDVVLMDIHMPGIDGIDAAAGIRRLGGPRGQTPIVAVTAGMSPAEADAAQAAGIKLELDKPIQTEGLMRVIHDAMADALEPCSDDHGNDARFRSLAA